MKKKHQVTKYKVVQNSITKWRSWKITKWCKEITKWWRNYKWRKI